MPSNEITTTRVNRDQETAHRTPLPAWIPRPVKRASGRAGSLRTPAHVRVIGVELDDEDLTHIRRKLGIKLGKFATSIERVSVRVTDVNGPRGRRRPSVQCKSGPQRPPERGDRASTPRTACRRRHRATCDGEGGPAKCRSQAHEAASRQELATNCRRCYRARVGKAQMKRPRDRISHGEHQSHPVHCVIRDAASHFLTIRGLTRRTAWEGTHTPVNDAITVFPIPEPLHRHPHP